MTPTQKNILSFILLVSLNLNGQYFAPKIDAIGLFSSERKVIRPGLEVAFARAFTAGLGYESGKFARGTYEIYTITNGSSSSAMNSSQEKEIYKVVGWGIIPELRYYPFTDEKPAPASFFIGGFFRYRQFTETYTGEDAQLSSKSNQVMANISTKGTNSGGGIMFGYKSNIALFAVEMLGGVGVEQFQWSTPNERKRIQPDLAYGTENVNFRLEINIGFVFPTIKREKKILENVPYAQTRDTLLQQVAKVIIFRERKSRGSGVTYKLYANDSLLTTIESGSYFEYTCSPGVVKFQARTGAISSITLQLDKGRTYYLECGIRSGVLYSDPGFDLLEFDEGEERSWKLKK